MQTNKGQVAILVAVFFMLISAVVSSAVVALGVSQLKVANEFLLGKKSFATAESGIEDVALRAADPVKYAYNGPSPAQNEEVVLIGQGSAFVETTSASGAFILTTTGNVSQRFRQLTAKFSVANAEGIGFPAAITVGYLGTILNNSVQIQNAVDGHVGNVWSNGTVNAAGSGDSVTGDVKVSLPIANAASAGDDSYAQVQAQADTGHIVLMRSNSLNKDVAMSFIADKTAYVTEIWLKIDRSILGTSNYPAMNVKILPNEKGLDRPLNLSSTISYRAFDNFGIIPVNASVPQHPPDWTKIRLNVNRTVYENERYWVVLDNSGTAYTSFYRLYGASATSYVPQRSCYDQTWCNTSGAVLGTAELNPTTVGRVAISPDMAASNPTWYRDLYSDRDIAFKVIFGEPTYVNQSDPFNTTSNPYTTKAKEVAAGLDTRADTIENSDTNRTAYYSRYVAPVTAGPSGESCGSTPTTYCNPNTSAPDPFPIVNVSGTQYWQEQVAAWKQSVSSNSYPAQSIGNGQPPFDPGPATINGDLMVTGDGQVYVDDVLVVNGRLDLNNTCEIRNKKTNHRGFIIVSGKVTSDNSCKFDGNGSNIFIISMYYSPTSAVNSEPENTISFGNNSDGNYIDVVLFAPFGEIRIANSAKVTAMSAAKITAQNSGVIKYKDILITPQEPGDDLSRVPTFSAYYESQ